MQVLNVSELPMKAEMTHAVADLDPADIRRVATARAVRLGTARPGSAMRRAFVLAGSFAAAVCLGGVGFAAYSWLTPMLSAPETPKARQTSAIKMGPLPDMPDIRDGVPAIRRDGVVRNVAGAPAPSGGPGADREREVAAARALDMTVQTAALRPALSTPAAPAPRVDPISEDTRPVAGPKPAAEPQPATVRAAVPAQPGTVTASGSPAEPRPATSLPAPPVTPAKPAARPVETTASTVEAPVVVSSAEPGPAALPAPPLPPSRPATRQAEPKPERTAALPARPLPPTRSPGAAPRSPAASVTEAVPARAVPRASAEEQTQVLGVPVPEFVPQAGRRIRDAAGSVADAVSGLPDLF